jgi:hypothetical protein
MYSRGLIRIDERRTRRELSRESANSVYKTLKTVSMRQGVVLLICRVHLRAESGRSEWWEELGGCREREGSN